jgi:hypothetical protein
MDRQPVCDLWRGGGAGANSDDCHDQGFLLNHLQGIFFLEYGIF